MQKLLITTLAFEAKSGGGPARQGDGLLIHCPQGPGGSNPPLRAIFMSLMHIFLRNPSVFQIVWMTKIKNSLINKSKWSDGFPFILSLLI